MDELSTQQVILDLEENSSEIDTELEQMKQTVGRLQLSATK